MLLYSCYVNLIDMVLSKAHMNAGPEYDTINVPSTR